MQVACMDNPSLVDTTQALAGQLLKAVQMLRCLTNFMPCVKLASANGTGLVPSDKTGAKFAVEIAFGTTLTLYCADDCSAVV